MSYLILSEYIPLQQGLRLLPMAVQFFRHLIEYIPLQQGLRPFDIISVRCQTTGGAIKLKPLLY